VKSLKILESLPKRFPITLDKFQIMPNHFHGIIVIKNSVGAGLVPALSQKGRPQGSPLQKISLGNIVGAFKSLSTNAWAQGKLWQRNYYERIIRNEIEYMKIRQYIQQNPLNWENDRNNQKNIL